MMGERIVDEIIGFVPSPHTGWMYLRWTKPGKFKIRAVKALRAAEEMMKSAGNAGWVTSSLQEHTTMHKVLQKLGAVEYSQNATYKFFKKAVV